jgi:hypothetical protein
VLATSATEVLTIPVIPSKILTPHNKKIEAKKLKRFEWIAINYSFIMLYGKMAVSLTPTTVVQIIRILSFVPLINIFSLSINNENERVVKVMKI